MAGCGLKQQPGLLVVAEESRKDILSDGAQKPCAALFTITSSNMGIIQACGEFSTTTSK